MARAVVQERWAAPTASSPQTLAFTSDVTEGEWLFYVFAESDTPPWVSSITDTLSNVWYRIYGTNGTVQQPFLPTTTTNAGGVSIWAARASSDGACTLTITFSSTPSTDAVHGIWSESGWGNTLYPHVQFPITRRVFTSEDPIDFGSLESDQAAMFVAAMFVTNASAPYNTSATINNSFTIGHNGVKVSVSRRLVTVGTVVAPDLNTGSTESGDAILFAIIAEPFPSRALQMRFDASRQRHLSSGVSGIGPTGVVSTGDSAERLWSTVFNHTLIPSTSVTVFQPYDITWEDDTVLTNPSIKCAAGSMELVAVPTSGSVTHADVVSLNDMTFFLSFLIESTADLDDNATVYFNSPLWGEGQNAYYGLFLRYTGGQLRLYIYNWDGNADTDFVVIAANTKYVVRVKHAGTSMTMTVYEPTATTGAVTITTGATTNSTAWQVNYSNATGTRQVRARYGEALCYGDDLSSQEDIDATDYMTQKWFSGLSSSQILASFVAGYKGTVTSSRTVLFNLDGVTRQIDDASGQFIVGGSLRLIEQSAAPTGVANSALIYTEDNGSGKTRLMAQFGSGSAVQIAIEP